MIYHVPALAEVDHPIAKVCFRALSFQEDRPTGITPQGRAQLLQELEKERGKPSLKEAVLELVLLAFYFDNQGFEAASQALLEVARTAEPALAALGTSMDGVIAGDEAVAQKKARAVVGAEPSASRPGAKPVPPSAKKWWELKKPK